MVASSINDKSSILCFEYEALMPMISVPLVGQELHSFIGARFKPPIRSNGCLIYEVSQALEKYWAGLSPGVQYEVIMRADRHRLDLRRVLSFLAGSEAS